MGEAGVKIVQAIEGAQEGRLATAGRSDNGETLVREDLQVEVPDGRLSVETGGETVHLDLRRLHDYRPTLATNRRISQ